jgi:hypothetical protein
MREINGLVNQKTNPWHKNRITSDMRKNGKQKGQDRPRTKNDDPKSPTPEYVLKPGIDLSKISSDHERLDITETDEDEDEGVGDGNIGQSKSDFENGLRDV